MTQQEFNEAWVWLGNVCPQFAKQHEFSDMPTVRQFWQDAFGGLEADVFKTAVTMHMAKSPFAPGISDVFKILLEADESNGGGYLTISEAWGEVTRAISLYGYTRPKEALASMSELTRKCVRAITWQELCHTTEHATTRAHFERYFKELRQKQANAKAIPALLSQKMAGLLPKGGGGFKAADEEIVAKLPEIDAQENERMKEVLGEIARSFDMTAVHN